MIIFIIAAWGGNNGGVLAGLASATAMAVLVGSAADLMQDFKTGVSVFSAQICATRVNARHAALRMCCTCLLIAEPGHAGSGVQERTLCCACAEQLASVQGG